MYQVISDTTILRLSDNAFIPVSSDNADYKTYLIWLEQGNNPSVSQEIEEPNWRDFNEFFLGSQQFNLWLASLPQMLSIAIVSSATGGRLNELQQAYDIAKNINAPSSELIEEWRNVASNHFIAIVF